jgi:hypothetical protein
MAAHHPDIAGMILDALFLFEARLMCFIDHDQSEVGIREK